METIYLIVRADDFGVCHAANQAIGEAFETGLLSCASLSITGPWVAEAVEMMREHPEWEIGLQLSLSCNTRGCRWGPIAGSPSVPSLAEPTGNFFPTLPATATSQDIEKELESQIERARAWEIKPAYLEYPGEPHPAVDLILHQLNERTGVPARMTAWGIQPLAVPLPSAASGPRELARETAMLEVLAALTPGVYLWAAQPANDSPESWALWSSDAARDRQADAVALASPRVRALIEKRGIEVISFRQHLEMRLGTAADE